jgi:hypothetical protein
MVIRACAVFIATTRSNDTPDTRMRDVPIMRLSETSAIVFWRLNHLGHDVSRSECLLLVGTVLTCDEASEEVHGVSW